METPRKGDVAVFLGVFCLAEWLLCNCAGDVRLAQRAGAGL